jgi:hypothetical protein
MTFTEIDPKFAVASKIKEQLYPALQVTNYKPQTLDEQINFCLSENSFNLLDRNQKFIEIEITECAYGREAVLMHKIVSPVRWIFLNIPRIFLQDKTTKEISLPQKGVKLFGTNKVTVAKCFLACLVEDKLLLDIEGLPQIFTLKLTSSKTQLIGYQVQSENKSILALNKEIQKHFKTRDNLVHLVSIDLKARAKEFVSNHSGDSSLGVDFQLVGNAKVLKQEHQQQVFNLVTNEEIIALFDDPFGLNLTEELNSSNDYLSTENIDF